MNEASYELGAFVVFRYLRRGGEDVWIRRVILREVIFRSALDV